MYVQEFVTMCLKICVELQNPPPQYLILIHGYRVLGIQPDVTGNTTECILGFTGRLWCAIFEICLYIAFKLWDQ